MTEPRRNESAYRTRTDVSPSRDRDWIQRAYEVEALYYGYRHDDRERDADRAYAYRTNEPSQGEGRYGRSDWDLAGASERERHNQDSFGQQVRDVSHHVARRIKHVFRGPKGYKRSDERIREDVHECLTRQREIDAGDIEVTVSQGEVTLTGTIASRHEKFVAEEIADAVNGVTDVHNWLRRRGARPIETVAPRTDAAAATAIDEQQVNEAPARNARL